MSYCVCTMQKMKMSDMGGMQSHNQREHESRKNHEIDAERTPYNYELVNDGHLHYVRAVKDRIAELNLPKAVRKDAVVACSFIIGSDREWHEERAKELHDNQRYDGRIWYDDRPWEDLSKAEQTELIADATRSYYQDAVCFLQNRYGKENVLVGSVHVDEAGAPHMHAMVVPVTKDGRLSAKAIFTPEELRSLQTAFWERVGRKYDLERGREGSDVKHLDEVTYKLKVRSEELDEVTEQLNIVDCVLQETLEQNREEDEKLQNAFQKLQNAQEDLQSVLEDKKDAEERLEALEGKIEIASKMLDSMTDSVIAMDKELKQIEQSDVRLMEQFVAHPNIAPAWEQYRASSRTVAEKRRMTKEGLLSFVERKQEERKSKLAEQQPVERQRKQKPKDRV